MARRRGSMVPARGAHRRLQALVARGWSQAKLADRLGMHNENFARMMHQEFVTAEFNWRVTGLYEQLWDKQPAHDERYDRAAFQRALRFAAARRWVPPLGWDDIDTDEEPPVVESVGGIDEIAVELAMSGEAVRLSSAERREAVSRLNAQRFNDQAIADRLRVWERTVVRIRRELGLAAVPKEDWEVA